MFIGHFAVGFASKKLAPKTSLGVLIAAPILLDLLWPIFLLLGWESVRIDPGNTKFTALDFVSYPYSHSLLMATGWSILFGGLYWRFRRDRKASLVVAFGVLSHWAMDALAHRPDLPITPWSNAKAGLGLWNHVAATIIIESALFLIGVWIYAAATRSKDKTGTYVFWAFVTFLAVAYAANIVSPPPPNVRMLALVALLTWLFPFWAGWFDRHRRADV